MFQLSISATCAYVRRVLDELTSVEEIGMLVSPDAVDIHKLVEGTIVESAVKIHNLAPAIMLDGVKGTEGDDYTLDLANNVITITMKKDTIRVSSIKAMDSDIVVCDFIPEDSAEGRKQLNKYVRGIPDDPRVVLAKEWNGNYQPILRYYTYLSEKLTPMIELYYVPYPEINETIVEICPKLEYAVLNEVVASVLDSLNEHDKAALYRDKAMKYLEGK
jgi:hypothetical protein